MSSNLAGSAIPAPTPEKGYHRLERTTEPCVVGFDVSGDASCPLYQMELTLERLGAFWKWRATAFADARRFGRH